MFVLGFGKREGWGVVLGRGRGRVIVKGKDQIGGWVAFIEHIIVIKHYWLGPHQG